MIIESSSVGGRIYNDADTVGVSRRVIGTPQSTERLARGVTIKAAADNTAAIYVGGPEVTVSNGYPLAAGESLFLAVASISQIYVVATVANEAYAWVGL